MNGVVEPTNWPSKSQPSTQTKETKPVKECPKTPANRIPLADLISNTEDAIKLAPGKELTPDDYVSWQHVPRSSDPPSATPATRGKKRRHSSSPTSSPLKGGREGGIKKSFDLKAFEALLKTPQSDLATDLWNSYVGKSTIDGNVELPPHFANLSSSPQTPLSVKTSRDSSGLRRSTSCNVNWPTSNAKRRRIEGYGDMRTVRNIFARSRSNVLDSGKSAKLSFLLDKVRESLAKSANANATGARGASPSPDQGDVSENRSPSPRKAKRKPQAAGQPTHDTEETEKDHYETGPANKAEAEGSSSEFGDDDFDEDLLALVESSTIPFTNSTKTEIITPSFSKTGFDPEQSPSPAEKANRKRLSASNADAKKDDDEFNDDDEFTENMEELLAQYDGGISVKRSNSPLQAREELANSAAHVGEIHSGVACGQQVQRAKNSGDVSSGDEFDDEDFDLVAIEDSMLQSRPDARDQVGYP
jgi:DNA replication ATP-dependent helicase Dna2